jgi:hypothetical protein
MNAQTIDSTIENPLNFRTLAEPEHFFAQWSTKPLTAETTHWQEDAVLVDVEPDGSLHVTSLRGIECNLVSSNDAAEEIHLEIPADGIASFVETYDLPAIARTALRAALDLEPVVPQTARDLVLGRVTTGPEGPETIDLIEALEDYLSETAIRRELRAARKEGLIGFHGINGWTWNDEQADEVAPHFGDVLRFENGDEVDVYAIDALDWNGFPQAYLTPMQYARLEELLGETLGAPMREYDGRLLYFVNGFSWMPVAR